MVMSHHESELIPDNVIELNTTTIELNGSPVKVKSRVPLFAYPKEICEEGEVVEVSTASRLGLQLFAQDVYPAAIIYTDGSVRRKIPHAFHPRSNGTDQLDLSNDATYLAWTTNAPADDPHLKRDSQTRPFRHHLITTKRIAEIRVTLGPEGNKRIKFVNSPLANMFRTHPNGDWDPKNIG